MNANGRLPERLLIACFVLAAVTGIGCGGGDGGGSQAPLIFAASFTPSGTPPAPNLVRLEQVSVDGDEVTIDAVIDGPTTSPDLYSFAFDLVLSNATLVQYIPGSAEAGTALTVSGSQSIQVGTLQSGARIIVGVSKIGGGFGNGVAASEASIIRLTFKVFNVGTSTVSFSGSTSPSNPTGEPVALDSNGTPIGSIVFDATPAIISGS